MKLPAQPPSLQAVLDAGNDEAKQKPLKRLFQLLTTDVGKDRGDQYLHWDTMRYKPLPKNIDSHEEWWFVKKFRRTGVYRQLPFIATANRHFVYWLPDAVYQRLHQVDQAASGRVQIAEQVTNRATRDRYLVNSLIEEAITSSQLEGASTTHKVAKAMLREGRKPRDKSEQMIFNNYRAMGYIRDVATGPLTKDMLLELHQIVTQGTLDDPDAEGRFRLPNDDVAVYDARDNTLLHQPPDAEELNGRVQRICDFANSESDDRGFMHPVVRSIILHFMIGYNHPFVDGNGRTARALFYWSMAQHGYWMMEYVSISTILKNGPSKYARAYLYTETDDFDTTYFIDFNLRVIIRAIGKLQEYLATKAKEIRSVEILLGSSLFAKKLNHRQIALVSHALRNPGELYTIESHKESHRVSYPTARSDLLQLAQLALLDQRKMGNAFVFRGVDNIRERLEELRVQAEAEHK